MAGPLDYLRKQNSMMPPNLAAAAQRNLASSWQQTNNVNFANRKVADSTASPVAAAMQTTQQPLQPSSFSLSLSGTPDTSIGSQLPQLNQTTQGQQAPAQQSVTTNSPGADHNWRFQNFNDMYGAHNATQAVLSPQATANYQKQYGWGGATS